MKGFKFLKANKLELGDTIEFFGKAHPSHKEPIKLTGVIELSVDMTEVGVRSRGYHSWHPFDSVNEINKI